MVPLIECRDVSKGVFRLMSRTGTHALPSLSMRMRLKKAMGASPTVMARLTGLNPSFYRAAYFDVRPLTDAQLVSHWILTGRGEKRIPSWSRLVRAYRSANIDPASIDPIAYFSMHVDLAPSGIDSVEAACVHYLRVGSRQERRARLDIPEFLDVDRHPHLADLGWTVPRDEAPQRNQREARASTRFHNTLEAHLVSLDAEQLAVSSFLEYHGFLPELPHFDQLVAKLDVGVFSRAQWLINLVSTVQDVRASGLAPRSLRQHELTFEDIANESSTRHADPIMVMGIPVMTAGEWHLRAYAQEEVRYAPRLTETSTSMTWSHRPTSRPGMDGPRVSVLCSMYRTGELLESFLSGLVAQTIFSFTEFILVLVDPTEHERETCERFAAAHENVVLLVSEQRIGIYDAWNLGVSVARGEFITNMNVDDVRAPESLETQAALLDQFSWVDVVYQDVMVSLDSRLGWNAVSRTGAKLGVTKSSRTTFASYRNPPHNAPMWRRALHDEVGLFDTSLVSAGDFDFWYRCAAAGKIFFNVSQAHVGYFINPEGLSTRKETRGYDEGREIVRRHKDDFIRGPKPAYVDDATRALPIPRSERVTLGFIRHVNSTPARSEQSGTSR